MKRNKQRLPEGDDGHTIVNMNVEGMPWYKPPKPAPPPGAESLPQETLEPQSRFAMWWGVLRAALLVTAVFSAGIVLFVLFCIHVWFK